MTTFSRMAETQALVKYLTSEGLFWWHRIVALSKKDKDINIQIRPDSLNVYCKMGSLFQIKMRGKQAVCRIHYKYLLNHKKNAYIEIKPKDGEVRVLKNIEDFQTAGDLLTDNILKNIKQNISNHVGEEKIIQSKLIEKNKDTILDVEVAFSDKESSDDDTRIDIVNYDKKTGKVVFVELKQIFDSRLYKEEINKQLRKYSKFIKKNKTSLVTAYQNVINTKIRLGLINDNSPLCNAQIKAEDIEDKILLVICGHNQIVIDSLKDKIMDNCENLLGIYMFGDTVDLNLTKGGNKILF